MRGRLRRQRRGAGVGRADRLPASPRAEPRGGAPPGVVKTRVAYQDHVEPSRDDWFLRGTADDADRDCRRRRTRRVESRRGEDRRAHRRHRSSRSTRTSRRPAQRVWFESAGGTAAKMHGISTASRFAAPRASRGCRGRVVIRSNSSIRRASCSTRSVSKCAGHLPKRRLRRLQRHRSAILHNPPICCRIRRNDADDDHRDHEALPASVQTRSSGCVPQR